MTAGLAIIICADESMPGIKKTVEDDRKMRQNIEFLLSLLNHVFLRQTYESVICFQEKKG
jgi:hypothetical protein